eukprot:43501-Eustigmatos_ZCMA.PRE.1
MVKRRAEQRKHRELPTVALLGYTNVGKSSLLNRLAGVKAVTERDRPFETLDTVQRGVYLPDRGTREHH